MTRRTVTTQATSKRYKGAGCFGQALAIPGIGLALIGWAVLELWAESGLEATIAGWASLAAGVALLFGSAALQVFARVGAWWANH